MVLRISNSIIPKERNFYVKSASMVDVYSLNTWSWNICGNSTRHEIFLIHRFGQKTCLKENDPIILAFKMFGKHIKELKLTMVNPRTRANTCILNELLALLCYEDNRECSTWVMTQYDLDNSREKRFEIQIPTKQAKMQVRSERKKRWKNKLLFLRLRTLSTIYLKWNL